MIGPGRMGLTVGALVLERGLAREVTFFGRRAAPPAHALFGRPDTAYARELTGPPPAGAAVVIAVPDGAVGEVAGALARTGDAPEGAVAVHLSGALPASALDALRACGYAVASLHPLQTVASPDETAERLRGAAFAFEGDARARPVAEAIARAAAGRLFEVPAGSKAKYHAACVFASNYVVANAAVAARLLAEAASIPEDQALGALLPLVEGARANLERWGLPRALTGPIARGDLEVIRRHLDALDAPTRGLYSAQAREALRLARTAGLDPRRADEIERLLDVGG